MPFDRNAWQRRRRRASVPAGDSPEESLYRSLAAAGKSDGTHALWIDRAVEAIRELAVRHAEFTSEDLFAKVGRPDDARQAGTAFREAARSGIVAYTGRVTTSHASGRARPVAIWESLL